MNNENFALKPVAITILLIFLGVQILIPINEARAADLGGGWASATQIGSLVTKEYILDLIARIAAAVIIRSITNEIISWIQGDGGKNVGFVGNLEQEFRRQIDARGGEFLNQITGINLCTADVRAALLARLQLRSLRERLECTLTEIVANANDFYRNFDNGGWPAFISITTVPQNNPQGAYLIALDGKLRTESALWDSQRTNYVGNRGFFGSQSYTPRCSQVSAERAETEVPRGGRFCPPGYEQTIEYHTNTPGGAVAGLLDKSLGSGIDWTVVSDEISEAIVAIATALINKLVSVSFSGNQDSETEQGLAGGSGIFDPQIGTLIYSPDPTTISAHVIAQIDEALAMGQDALQVIDDPTLRQDIQDSMDRLREFRALIQATTDITVALPLYRAALAEIRFLQDLIRSAGIASLQDRMVALDQRLQNIEDAINANSPPPPPPPPPSPSTPSIPSSPTGLNSSCSSPTFVSLSWNAPSGATSYLVRVNNTLSDSSSCVDGWYCSDPPDKLIDNHPSSNYSTTVISGQPHIWWVHACNSLGCSSATAGSFNCFP